MYTLNCKGKLLVLDQPLVMGIINATLDSFFEGHLDKGVDGILLLADQLIAEGADILDIGGQSTHPGSKRISESEETERVLPVITAIHAKYPDIPISIDTYQSNIAKAAVEAGASIVNDIGAGRMDEAMIPTIAALNVPYICMHSKGTPETMQENPQYEDVLREVLDFFILKV